MLRSSFYRDTLLLTVLGNGKNRRKRHRNLFIIQKLLIKSTMHIIESVSLILKTLTWLLYRMRSNERWIPYSVAMAFSQLLKLYSYSRHNTNKSERDPCNQQKVFTVKFSLFPLRIHWFIHSFTLRIFHFRSLAFNWKGFTRLLLGNFFQNIMNIDRDRAYTIFCVVLILCGIPEFCFPISS